MSNGVCYNNFVMKIKSDNNNLIITELTDFDIVQIFECGQCFRWDRLSDGSFIGVAYNKALKIFQNSPDTVTLFDTSIEDFENIWYNYFDFGTSYSDIKTSLSSDKILKHAIAYGEGIRILNQDLWECVVSFIISQSNNIPRIKKIISTLCTLYGEKINYLGDVYYSFPSPEKILSRGPEGLLAIRAGFRDKYILAAADAFVNSISFDTLSELSYDEAKKELMKIKGIGNKVADCILLFSLAKRSSFPVDVWIKRIMEYCYFDNEQPINIIREFADEKFGQYSGYAQQYLFYYARENKIGI